VQQVTLQICQP